MSEEKCQICCSTKFKYSCPKCNILYCSVQCYKSSKHQECSEAFYQKCVQDEMATTVSKGNDVQNIYNILNRTGIQELVNDSSDPNGAEEIDSDDEDGLDMSARLQDVNINDADAIWSRLTAEEKHEFESLIKTGKITTLLPEFDPWWNKMDEKKLIEDISESKRTQNTYSYPEVLTNIQPYDNLCKKEPSPCLWYNLCNILGAYTCTVRYFNGEHLVSPTEATKYIYLLSTNLNNNTNFDSNEQAIKSIILDGQLSNNAVSVDDYETIYDNVQKIIEGPSPKNRNNQHYNLAALSDLWKLFTEARKELNKNNESNAKISNSFSTIFSDFHAGNVKLTKTILNNLIKKIEYFLSFVNKG